MTLQQQLNDLREQFESKAPPEAVALMHRATDDLAASGAMDALLKAGDKAPAFSLAGRNGDQVRSSDLLAKGPLVVSFYRGVW